MGKWKYFIIGLLLIAFTFSRIVIYNKPIDNIREALPEKDYEQIKKLFRKGDNWYWLISNAGMATYSVDHMLLYKSSSQYERRNDLILRVFDIDGNVAGFLAYYPKSPYVWQLLFLAVDQDYRRQGIARKLLNYAVKDMVARGAIKIDMVTRNNNVRSLSLYKPFGFKEIDDDGEIVSLTWHKSQLN